MSRLSHKLTLLNVALLFSVALTALSSIALAQSEGPNTNQPKTLPPDQNERVRDGVELPHLESIPSKQWPDLINAQLGPGVPPATSANGHADHVDELHQRIVRNLFSISFTAIIITVIAILIRQIGYALFQIGMGCSGTAAKVFGKCLLICPLVGFSFWVYGFAVGWGNWYNGPVAPGWYGSLGQGTSVLDKGIGVGPVYDESGQFTGEYRWGLAGTKGFFLCGVIDPSVILLFLFFWSALVRAATIPIVAIGEPWSWKNFCAYGLWITLPFALVANWIWAGGWLAQLGRNWHFGHGAVDFAGSGAVYALGGIIALAGIVVAGSQSGRHRNNDPSAVRSRNGRLILIGTCALALPEIASSCQVLWQNNIDPSVRLVAINTGVAAVAASCVAAGLQWWRQRTGIVLAICQGYLAGYVAISAPCGFVEIWAAAVIGAIAAAVVELSANWWDRCKIDDPTRFVSIFGISGLWGVLSVGFFASGLHSPGFNGVERYLDLSAVEQQQWQNTVGVAFDGVRGILYGDPGQLWAQVVYCFALAIFAFASSYVGFKLTNLILPVRIFHGDSEQCLDQSIAAE